jgi:chitinase
MSPPGNLLRQVGLFVPTCLLIYSKSMSPKLKRVSRFRIVNCLFMLALSIVFFSGCMQTSKFRVVGYAIAGINVGAIQFDKLTHINYAFLTPNKDGTFAPIGNPVELREIVEKAHAEKVKVLVSIGGWGWNDEFETLASDPNSRTTFVSGLVDLIKEFKLDGVDIDWEFPILGKSSDNFLALIQELRDALPNKLLTCAVVSLGSTGEGVPSSSFEIFDFVNIMAYDGDGHNHSPYELAEKAIHYWLGRGLPASKAVLGVPFYSRPIYSPYWKIVEKDPQAAYIDEAKLLSTTINYNGIPTIQRKTELALNQASGIMIWALNYDSADKTSLLSAINRTIQEFPKP